MTHIEKQAASLADCDAQLREVELKIDAIRDQRLAQTREWTSTLDRRIRLINRRKNILLRMQHASERAA